MNLSNIINLNGIARRLLACCPVLVMIAFMQQATAATYTASTVASTAFDTTTTAVVWDNVDTGFPNDDDKQLVNIGFTFYLGSVAYTQVRILTNGALHFGANQGFHKHYTNTALPITTSFNASLIKW